MVPGPTPAGNQESPLGAGAGGWCEDPRGWLLRASVLTCSLLTPPALLGQAFLDRALKFESKQGVEKEMTQVRGAAGGCSRAPSRPPVGHRQRKPGCKIHTAQSLTIDCQVRLNRKSSGERYQQ